MIHWMVDSSGRTIILIVCSSLIVMNSQIATKKVVIF